MSNRRCRDCENARKLKQRNTTPPTGYVRARAVAKRIGCDDFTIIRQIRRGWMAGYVWQHVAGGTWWIEDRLSYELWS
jgi:hypothetical protein